MRANDGFGWGLALLVALGALVHAHAHAQNARPPSGGGIYTCIDDKGNKLTSDRPIAACAHKEQHVLNRDGSIRSVVPPTLTTEERAEREARERQLAEARAAQADAVRRDRNLMQRFKNEEAHAKAREQALEPVKLAIQSTERRLKDLAAERVPLLNEAEFYIGKPLPTKIKLQLDANEAAMAAQKEAATTQAAELERVNKLFDAELDRLRKLWGGVQPGSLGPLAAVPGVPAAAGPGASRPRLPSR
jgi:hypothetical protein